MLDWEGKDAAIIATTNIPLRILNFDSALSCSDAGNFSRPTMKFKILGQYPREGKRWQIGEETAGEDEAEKINYVPFWSHLKAEDVGTAQAGKEILNSIMGQAIGFDTVKPPKLFVWQTARLIRR